MDAHVYQMGTIMSHLWKNGPHLIMVLSMGLRSFFFTRRDEGDVSHFLLITVWDTLEAVKKFAGDDPSVAKYYPEDDKFF